jgi:hypothetical protein
VLIDGAPAGTTDQTGKLTITRTFATAGSHSASVDVNPYPAATGGIWIFGKSYTVTSNPSPIPVDKAITLSLKATDENNQLVPGTFTLTSGTGTRTIRSGASANVTLALRYEIEIGPNDKPTRVKVCPEIAFEPDSNVFDPSDASHLVSCR